jgi:hypothetical protein
LEKADKQLLNSSPAFDLGCVKTPGGMGAPGILSLVAMRRARKRQNFSSARHYDQISFRFRAAKTHRCHARIKNVAAQN